MFQGSPNKDKTLATSTRKVKNGIIPSIVSELSSLSKFHMVLEVDLIISSLPLQDVERFQNSFKTASAKPNLCFGTCSKPCTSTFVTVVCLTF